MTGFWTALGVLLVLALLLWGVDRLPLDKTIVGVIKVLAIVLAVYWVLSLFFPGLPRLHA
jgi:hypothetical protein